MVGSAVLKAVTWVVTEMVYGKVGQTVCQAACACRRTGPQLRAVLARTRQISTAPRTRLTCPCCSATSGTWEGAGLLAGATWDEVNAHGRAMRALWARFAYGEGLGSRGEIPGSLRYRSV